VRTPRVVVAVTAVVAVAVVGVGWAHARQSPQAGEYARTTCALGSDQLRAATADTLAGLDPGIFSRFRVLEPPPPPLTSDHYRGPLWVYATIAGSRDLRTRDMTAEWEARLATGAIAERCSLGMASLPEAVAGFTARYATGRHRLAGGGAGYSQAGRVLGAQASGESDDEVIATAKRVLADYGLTPRTVRVLHPLGPALLVEASTDDVSSVAGKVPDIGNALDGGGWGEHPRFEGVYLALDGPDGPLVRTGGATRAAGGFGWSAPGFDTGIQHG
jgi:hypothetical protein